MGTQRRSNTVMCTMPLKPLMNIPKTKHHQYQQSERCAAKIMMGLGGVCDAENISPVRSSTACLCGLQSSFMWRLRARWMAVIDLDLTDSFMQCG